MNEQELLKCANVMKEQSKNSHSWTKWALRLEMLQNAALILTESLTEDPERHNEIIGTLYETLEMLGEVLNGERRESLEKMLTVVDSM